MRPRRPALFILALPLYPASPSCLQRRLQICPFIFNNFHDAPPATPFFSKFCIVARGGMGLLCSPFSLFRFPPPLTPLQRAAIIRRRMRVLPVLSAAEGSERPQSKDPVRVLSPLQCAVTRFPPVSLLECALTKMGSRNSFRMRSYEKKWGGGGRYVGTDRAPG